MILICAALAAACDRAPDAGDLREWSAADHDKSEENAKQARGRQVPDRGGKGDKADEARALVELTWKNQCEQCHGPVGRGDGPNGALVKATDLTQEAWQGKISDAEIAASIKNGKGRMLKFDLADPVVAGLVARIRAVRGR